MIFEGGRKRLPIREENLHPLTAFADDGRLQKFEPFSHYVARQLGIADAERYPVFCNAVDRYLRAAKDWKEEIHRYFAKEDDGKALSEKLIHELDACILGYFAFHWKHSSSLITEAASVDSPPKSRLKNMVMAATRTQVIERLTRDLKVTRVFSTLVDEIKAMGAEPGVLPLAGVATSEKPSGRRPVLLLMGGGMGAGKSTVLKNMMNERFWAESANKVIVEADAFKESDVIFRALLSRGHADMIHTSELVHQSSTHAASSLLVTALNEGRDVIMDGTLSWEPYVVQTIAMARNVHRRRYRMGVGYKAAADDSVTENYWEEVEEDEATKTCMKNRRPYKIEFVGVVCDAHLAVVRGIRRAIVMGRGVRVKSQLRSHRMFASALHRYCDLVDEAKLYSTNAIGGPPKLIGWKKEGAADLQIDRKDYEWLKRVSLLNEDADSVEDLYKVADSSLNARQIWRDVVASPSRKPDQLHLFSAITRSNAHELLH
ncbi:unnamed protein product [Victoria cruziana]